MGPDRRTSWLRQIVVVDDWAEEFVMKHGVISDAFAVLALSALVGCAQVFDSDGDGVVDSVDCAPDDPAISQLATDVPGNGVDEDCDGTDAPCDLDADGIDSLACGGGDCNDFDPAIHPGAGEECDGIDTDCSGEPEPWEVDEDGDGWRQCDDCNDASALVFPGADEVCNGVDDDCDGTVPAEERDGDLDAHAPCEGDCDDNDFSRHPDADDGCDDIDNDCNGVIDDEWDTDGDGWCVADCDNEDASVFPGNWLDVPTDGVDHDCDGAPGVALAAARLRIAMDPCVIGNGTQVESVGDFDGDGLLDLAFGSANTDSSGCPLNVPGRVSLVSGADLSRAVDQGLTVLSLAAPSLLVYGDEPGFGYLVSSGDVDGDGWDELAVAYGWGSETRARIFYGPDVLTGDTIRSSDTAFSRVVASTGDTATTAMTLDGDADADGGADLVIAGQTATYWFSGPTQSYVDLDWAPTKIETPSASILAYLGDLDGNPGDELALRTAAGDILLFLGTQLAEGGVLQEGDAHAVLETAGTSVGESGWFAAIGAPHSRPIRPIDDVDGDGAPDILIGEPGAAPGSSGAVHLLSGAVLAAGGSHSLEAVTWLTIEGASDELLGHSIGSGDFDADGLIDVVLGAPFAPGESAYGGRVHLILGSMLRAWLPTGNRFDTADAGGTFIGADPYEYAGASTDSVGDLNGDGRDDLFVWAARDGAPPDPTDGVGAAWVLLSRL